MPKHVGRKWKRVAAAHEALRAATEALTAALHLHKPTSKAMRELHLALQSAREQKEQARAHHEYEFDCSFCGKKFRSVHRLIFEVPLATEHNMVTRIYKSDSTGEEVEVEEPAEVWELRDRISPHYLIAGPCCLEKAKERLTY